MNYKNISKSLHDKSIFCLWRYEEKGGLKTKPPYSAKTRLYASADNPSNFVLLEEAVAKVSGFSGIGMRVSEGFLGIDLDHCLESGKLLPWAKGLSQTFQLAISSTALVVMVYTSTFSIKVIKTRKHT